MAPQGKQTVTEVRHLVVKLSLDGKPVREIGQIVGRSKSTVQGIIQRYREQGRISNKSRLGQGKLLNNHDERRILKEVKTNPKISAPKLASFVRESLNKDVCTETVRNVLRSNGLNGRSIRKKPYISPKNKLARVKFAQEYLLKSNEFWDTVKGRQSLQF